MAQALPCAVATSTNRHPEPRFPVSPRSGAATKRKPFHDWIMSRASSPAVTLLSCYQCNAGLNSDFWECWDRSSSGLITCVFTATNYFQGCEHRIFQEDTQCTVPTSMEYSIKTSNLQQWQRSIYSTSLTKTSVAKNATLSVPDRKPRSDHSSSSNRILAKTFPKCIDIINVNGQNSVTPRSRAADKIPLSTRSNRRQDSAEIKTSAELSARRLLSEGVMRKKKN
ncbi:hypothetical protein DFH09DRAFT_1275266 [Mycena vulgaris]|nr:hypothetical protein DFH09DRAFT_1275266 [Mycena vulgaris]